MGGLQFSRGSAALVTQHQLAHFFVIKITPGGITADVALPGQPAEGFFRLFAQRGGNNILVELARGGGQQRYPALLLLRSP